MWALKQSTALTVQVFVHDANGDGITGIADGSFTKRISKGAGAWGAMTVTITEGEAGWYFLPLSTTHTDTLGMLAVSLSASGAKRVNLQWPVSARVLDDLATGAQATAIQADTDDIQTRLPAALVSGRMDSSTGAMAASVVTATAIAADAITAAKVASDVSDEIAAKILVTPAQKVATDASGFVTANLNGDLTATMKTSVTTAATAATPVAASVTGAVGSVTAAVTVGTINANALNAAAIAAGAITAAKFAAGAIDAAAFAQAAADKVWATAVRALTDKAGFSLSQSFPANFADLAIAVTTGRVTVGTNTDKTGYGLTSGEEDAIVDKVWDELLSGHVVAGSAGATLAGAGSAGDPWTTLLPGAYGAGTAGKIVGDNINATIASRAPEAGGNVAAIKAKTDNLPSAVPGAAGGLFIAGTNAATSVNITGNVTGNLSGSVGSVTGAVGSVTGNVGGSVNGSVVGSVGSVAGNVFGNVIGTIGGLAAQAKTEVNAEVADVVKIDTIPDRAVAVPPATPTFEQALSYIYLDAISKKVLNSTTGKKQLFNKAGVKIAEGNATDAAGVATVEALA
jgi:hypothetical protein